MILQLDFPIAPKAAATIEKRAKALQTRAQKKGAKLRILVPGLILYTSVLRALDIKTGPVDKKTGQPKYRIFRGKLNDIDPNAKPAKVAKIAKPAKVAKPAKAAKAATVEKPTRKPRVAKTNAPVPESAPVAQVPAAQPTPAAPQPGATAETAPPASAVKLTPSGAGEAADSSAPSNPAQAKQTHATRS